MMSFVFVSIMIINNIYNNNTRPNQLGIMLVYGSLRPWDAQFEYLWYMVCAASRYSIDIT